MKELTDKVVVITGASGGIGRAAAVAFARQGASLVLTARREDALHEVAKLCERHGVRTLVVPADVTDEASVQEVARLGHDVFGRIDVWVNNAAVSAYGRFEDTPSEVFRRVIETNFFGYVHGARAALPYLREHGGVLVNVGSVNSEIPTPFTSAYVASKHAILALGRTLRQELELESLAEPVHVISVLPATIDTPLFENAANYFGYRPVALPPVHSPVMVAKQVVQLVNHPHREKLVGRPAKRAVLAARLAPGFAERTAAKQAWKHHFDHDWAVAPHDGNVFAPREGHSRLTGGWRKRRGMGAAWLFPFLAGFALWLGFRERERAQIRAAAEVPQLS